MRKLIIAILIFTPACIYGQSFNREASLAPVAADGFYKIFLSPEISQHLNDALTDVRIFDGQQKEVPYLLQLESAEYYSKRFIEYEIVEIKTNPGRGTSLVLRNRSKTPINNIHLVIKNAEASREVSLSGSDDKANWFSIKDRFTLAAPQSVMETQEMEIVGFPWSNYEYYLLDIKDSVHAPLNILKAGCYETQSTDGNFISLPLTISAYDSAQAKKTYVEIGFNSLQFLEKLEVEVGGVKYYRRNATLFEKRVRTSKNGNRSEFYSPIKNFEVTTGRKAIIELNEVRGQQFLIEIVNDDNPPLTISSIKAFQLNRYLTAWLTKATPYTIRFDQAKVKAPVYDLGFFKDSIPNHAEIIEAGNIRLFSKNAIVTAEPFFTTRSVIWIALIIVIIILGYMSVKLVRETESTKSKP